MLEHFFNNFGDLRKVSEANSCNNKQVDLVEAERNSSEPLVEDEEFDVPLPVKHEVKMTIFH